MIDRIIAVAAPFAITAARIMATDPAMRNFIIDAFGGKTPSTSRKTPVRPHQKAQSFGQCPACRGTGLVPIYETVPRDERDYEYYQQRYTQPSSGDGVRPH